MVLIDSSVWIDHFRGKEPALAELLVEGHVLTHPSVVEELACGSLLRREEALTLLMRLPRAPVATHEEVLGLIEAERLHGSGIGAVDAQLIASSRLGRCRLWSKDLALARAARRLGLAVG